MFSVCQYKTQAEQTAFEWNNMEAREIQLQGTLSYEAVRLLGHCFSIQWLGYTIGAKG